MSRDEIWRNIVSRGQDLCCFKCRHQLQWNTSSDAVILCEGCGIMRPQKDFDAETHRAWQSLSDETLFCLVSKVK